MQICICLCRICDDTINVFSAQHLTDCTEYRYIQCVIMHSLVAEAIGAEQFTVYSFREFQLLHLVLVFDSQCQSIA